MMATDDAGMVYSLHGRKIGFFGKGGAGKSTALVLTANALRNRGYTVTVLDADSTNFGLGSVLGVSSPPAVLMDYFGGTVFQGGVVSCPVDDPRRIPNAALRWDTIPPEYKAVAPNGIRSGACRIC